MSPEAARAEARRLGYPHISTCWLDGRMTFRSTVYNYDRDGSRRKDGD